MSGEKRIINGQIAQSKSRGKVFVKEIGRLANEANSGSKNDSTKK